MSLSALQTFIKILVDNSQLLDETSAATPAGESIGIQPASQVLQSTVMDETTIEQGHPFVPWPCLNSHIFCVMNLQTCQSVRPSADGPC